jgi:hypothetical protein
MITISLLRADTHAPSEVGGKYSWGTKTRRSQPPWGAGPRQLAAEISAAGARYPVVAIESRVVAFGAARVVGAYWAGCTSVGNAAVGCPLRAGAHEFSSTKNPAP